MKLAEFNHKHVYLVGGSSGIGFAIAKQLVQAGAHIILLARTEKNLIDSIKLLEAEREYDDQKIIYRSLDICNHEHTHETMDGLVESFGKPDVLINCAGRAVPQKFEDVSYQQFDDTLKINLYGCRNTIYALLPYMKENGGLIINTASIAGAIGVFGYTDYCASKFALIGFSEALRSEVKKYNINVKVLCPPDTDTPGYQIENLTKPLETMAISESASIMTPEQVAHYFFKALPKNTLLIIPGAAAKFSVLMKRLFPRLVEFVMDMDIKKVAKQQARLND